jgi:hypothetical protein
MQLLLESANELQPLGKPGDGLEAPDGCFQSGPNLYSGDTYEGAVVSHYHRERGETGNRTNIALMDVAISFKQPVSGIVEEVRVLGSQRQLKVGGQWYHGDKPGRDIFRDAAVGSVVQLVTFGCATNEKACLANPEKSKSDMAK